MEVGRRKGCAGEIDWERKRKKGEEEEEEKKETSKRCNGRRGIPVDQRNHNLSGQKVYTNPGF